MLKIILVQGFCRLKIKITQFLAGFHFRLKCDVFEINSKPVFMFSYSNHLMILTIALQSIHICLIKLDFLRAFDPTISHNLNSYQGPLF